MRCFNTALRGSACRTYPYRASRSCWSGVSCWSAARWMMRTPMSARSSAAPAAGAVRSSSWESAKLPSCIPLASRYHRRVSRGESSSFVGTRRSADREVHEWRRSWASMRSAFGFCRCPPMEVRTCSERLKGAGPSSQFSRIVGSTATGNSQAVPEGSCSFPPSLTPRSPRLPRLMSRCFVRRGVPAGSCRPWCATRHCHSLTPPGSRRQRQTRSWPPSPS